MKDPRDRAGSQASDGAMVGGRPHHVLVLTYWSITDALIQAYTLPYLRIIRSVLPPGSVIHLITLEKEGYGGHRLVEQGIQAHSFRYVPFGLKALGAMTRLVWYSLRLIRREQVQTIHAWCTPAGMIGYMLSVLSGKPLVLDSYEPHAEAMVENGTWSRSSVAFRILFLFEQWQSRRAEVHIACAEGMRDYAKQKYNVQCERFFVKPACVDLGRFALNHRKDPALLRELGLEGKLVAVYAGKFGGIYLGQEVFDLLRVAYDHWGERFHVLLLSAHPQEELGSFIRAAGLDPAMFTIRHVPHAEVPMYMGLGDFALTPVRSVPTKRYCTPIKDGEYWALGLPVMITPDISDDSRIIAGSGAGVVLEGLDPDSYHKAVLAMDAILECGMGALYERIRPLAEKYRNFGIAERIYRNIYGNGER